jgi:hypothetical protein
MFKQVFTLAIAFLASTAFAQKPLKPSNNSTEKLLIWKPTKKEYSYWNDFTMSFDLVDSTYYTFIPTQFDPTYLYRKNSSGIIDQSNTNQFDANGNRILESYMYYNFGTSTLDTNGKNISTYDSYNNRLSYKYFSYTAGVGTIQTHNIYIHQLNAQNKPTQTLVQRYNFTTSSFEDDERYTYTYHPSGKIMTYEAEYWTGTEWGKDEKYDLTLDANGFCTQIIISTESATGNNWEPYARYTNLTFENPYEDLYELDMRNYLQERYNTATTSFELYRRKNTTLSTNSRYSLTENYNSGNWETNGIIDLEYDNFGNKTRELDVYYNTSILSLDTNIYRIYQITLDGNNRPAQVITIDSNYNSKYRDVYSDYVQINIQVAQLEEEVVKNEFQLYPNPTNHSFSIEGIDFSTVTIYNSTGNLVYSSDAKSIEVSSLPAGMYYVRILNDDKLLGVQKLIKE